MVCMPYRAQGAAPTLNAYPGNWCSAHFERLSWGQLLQGALIS